MAMTEPADDDSTVRLLSGNTDAMVWATEWCRIARQIDAADDDREIIDEGWIVTWFANAMAAQENFDRRRETAMAIGRVLPVLGLTDEDTESAVFLALGAASVCWENIAGAGVFDSTRAEAIGHELIAHLRRLRLLS